jgi:DNA-binding transcriptional LysR family regulator
MIFFEEYVELRFRNRVRDFSRFDKDLAEHEAIVYCRDGRTQIWQFHRSDGPPAELMPPARLRLNDLGAMLDAVLAGQGIAWLPEWLVTQHFEHGDLIELLPDAAGTLEEIHLVWPAAPHLPTRVRAAIDALSDCISHAKWSVEMD